MCGQSHAVTTAQGDLVAVNATRLLAVGVGLEPAVVLSPRIQPLQAGALGNGGTVSAARVNGVSGGMLFSVCPWQHSYP